MLVVADPRFWSVRDQGARRVLPAATPIISSSGSVWRPQGCSYVCAKHHEVNDQRNGFVLSSTSKWHGKLYWEKYETQQKLLHNNTGESDDIVRTYSIAFIRTTADGCICILSSTEMERDAPLNNLFEPTGMPKLDMCGPATRL